MSSVLDNKVAKEKCQKFTSSDIVQTMLNLAGYTQNLAGHPVLENSFGSGNILTAIVKRYIDSCLAVGMTLDAISKALARIYTVSNLIVCYLLYVKKSLIPL